MFISTIHTKFFNALTGIQATTIYSILQQSRKSKVYHSGRDMTVRDVVIRDIKTTTVPQLRDVHFRDKIIKDCILLGSTLTVGMYFSRTVSCLHRLNWRRISRTMSSSPASCTHTRRQGEQRGGGHSGGGCGGRRDTGTEDNTEVDSGGHKRQKTREDTTKSRDWARPHNTSHRNIVIAT